jgi:endonuclease/exonuclease/phosphatase (EEP) superfamily protein YafD
VAAIIAGRGNDSGRSEQEKRMPVMHRSEAMPHAGLARGARFGPAGEARA